MADPNTDKTSGANPRILMVGAGAVGGYFGGRLAQAGRATSISCQNDGRSNDWVYRMSVSAISVERRRCPR
jgi:hypothetical protein